MAAMFLLLAVGGCKKSSPGSSASSESAPAGAAAAPAPGQAPAGSLADRLKAVQSGQADGTGKPVLPDWKVAQPGAPATAIPLVKGLVVVTAITDPMGDYESIKSIQDVNPQVVQLHYSADKPTPKMTGLLGGAEKGAADPKNEFPSKVEGTRLIDQADLANAHSYSELFSNKTEHYPGSTAIGASTEMLNQLRGGQQVEFHFAPQSQFAIFMQIGAQMEGHKADQPTLSQHAGMSMYSCMLHRVEATDLAVPVLLNDQRVELPALHAMCTLEDNQEAHIYYLDQPANPLTLAFQLGPLSSRLQTIKIMLPPPDKAAAVVVVVVAAEPRWKRHWQLRNQLKFTASTLTSIARRSSRNQKRFCRRSPELCRRTRTGSSTSGVTRTTSATTTSISACRSGAQPR
jgi:hypothetical protein